MRLIYLKLRCRVLEWRVDRALARLERFELDRLRAESGMPSPGIQTAIELVTFYALAALCAYLFLWGVTA